MPVSASSLLQVEEMEGLGGALFLRSNRGVQRCSSSASNHAQTVGQYQTHTDPSIYDFVFFTTIKQSCLLWSDSALEGVSSSSSTKDVGSASPLTDRKKHCRKKSMNQKGDAAAGQADGKNTVLGLKERLDFTQILFVIH